jgi:hypothetical protein
MRCYSCNANLSDYESTLKSKATGQYLDMCHTCINEAAIETTKYRDEETDILEEFEDAFI